MEEQRGGRLKKTRSPEVQKSLADRFNQLNDAENAWRKKVPPVVISGTVVCSVCQCVIIIRY